MKNIILIISLLFYSFSVVNAQKHVFFKSPWKGDVTVVKESKGGLNMPTITVPEFFSIERKRKFSFGFIF